MQLNIPQNVTPYNLLEPASDAAGRTSAHLSLKGRGQGVDRLPHQPGQRHPILLSPLQATAVAGTGSKAIRAARIWTKLDDTQTVFTAQLEAATYHHRRGPRQEDRHLRVGPREGPGHRRQLRLHRRLDRRQQPGQHHVRPSVGPAQPPGRHGVQSVGGLNAHPGDFRPGGAMDPRRAFQQPEA